MKPLTRDAVITEARAKVIWGESSEAVFSFLQTKGFGDKEAGELLGSLFAERCAEIRKEGLKRMAVGCAFLACTLAGYFFHSQGSLSHRAFSATIVLGFWGLWKLSDGFWRVLGAKKQRGEISNLTD